MQVLLVAVMAAASLAVSTSGDLEWSHHYANAKVRAAAEQRPLLVVLENSNDPAGRFDQAHLVDGQSQRDLLQHYRLCRMDVNTDYGKRVADAFGATSFPFTAITDKTAQYITFQASGSMTPEKWEQTLATRRDGRLDSYGVSVQSHEASKVIADWPTDTFYSVPSNCPNCVRNQYYR